jgi:hypothetical protein
VSAIDEMSRVATCADELRRIALPGDSSSHTSGVNEIAHRSHIRPSFDDYADLDLHQGHWQAVCDASVRPSRSTTNQRCLPSTQSGKLHSCTYRRTAPFESHAQFEMQLGADRASTRVTATIFACRHGVPRTERSLQDFADESRHRTDCGQVVARRSRRRSVRVVPRVWLPLAAKLSAHTLPRRYWLALRRQLHPSGSQQ